MSMSMTMSVKIQPRRRCTRWVRRSMCRNAFQPQSGLQFQLRDGFSHGFNPSVVNSSLARSAMTTGSPAMYAAPGVG